MARPLFEQYKDALRRGHVALAGDELELALSAYREAAALVTDRALPHASMGAVLRRLGRAEEALEAYDRAVSLNPDDEALAAARNAVGSVFAFYGGFPPEPPGAAGRSPLWLDRLPPPPEAEPAGPIWHG